MAKKQVKILLNPQLYQSLQAEAEAMGMKLATYITWLLTRRGSEGKTIQYQARQQLEQLMDIF